MEQRGVLVRRNGNGSETRFAFNGQQEALVVLLCCFLWPFIDTLWALGTAFFTLQVNLSEGAFDSSEGAVLVDASIRLCR